VYVDKEYLDAGYNALANAIILQACKDYRKALRGYKKNEIIKIRKFFHSQWYSELTKVNGDYILKRIESEELNGRKQFLLREKLQRYDNTRTESKHKVQN
jgi:hypothetical protein